MIVPNEEVNSNETANMKYVLKIKPSPHNHKNKKKQELFQL